MKEEELVVIGAYVKNHMLVATSLLLAYASVCWSQLRCLVVDFVYCSAMLPKLLAYASSLQIG